MPETPPRANVLLVDDQPESLMLLEAILEPLGLNLVRAASGKEALKRLLQEEFAVVLLDVRMPSLDGFETAALMKQRDRTRHVPIIFLTGGDDRSEVARGYSAGAVDYMLKPFEPEILRSKVSVFVDLFELKRSADQLAQRALHDPLTGLPNRALFRDRLAMALTRMRRRPTRLAVLFLDLDGFKGVNDSLGHEVGDWLLVEVAERLVQSVRPADTVARLGGDEFTVLCEAITDQGDALALAGRVLDALSAPFLVAGRRLDVTASMGIALAADAETSPEALLREADAALYRAKESGRACYAVFDEAMRTRVTDRVHAEAALRAALECDELVVRYRPQVRVDTGAVTAVEALPYWLHSDGRLLPPEDFLDVAEKSGFVADLGSWLLDEACRQAARWRAELGERAPTVCVNLSARQAAQADIVDRVATALSAAGAEPSDICLELPEGLLARDSESPLAALRGLKRLGVRIAVDDFGAGLSALGHLRRSPIDAVKVAPSFLAGLGRGGRSDAVVAAVVGLVHSLGARAVADGVNSSAHLAALRRLGFDAAQGDAVAPPASAAEVERLLAGAALPPPYAEPRAS